MAVRKPVAPFYGAAAVWVLYTLLFPLYRVSHFILVAVASAVVFFVLRALCKSGAAVQTEAKPAQPFREKEEVSSGNPELDKMLRDGRMAVSELKRLDANIADAAISADIVRLEEISRKIFDAVKAEPEKLKQTRKFMDYYLPTTLKLLNSYDRMSAQGVSGENIDTTLKRVEDMMDTIVVAFEKQLDSLFGAEALDISTDITVLEQMMAREGLVGEQLKAETVPSADDGIRLEL